MTELLRRIRAGVTRHIRPVVQAEGRPGADRRRIGLLAVTPWQSEQSSLRAIADHLQWDLTVAGDCRSAMSLLDRRAMPVVLCDRDLPGTDWRDSIKILLSSGSVPCVVLISSVNDEYLLREVVHCGGYDVLSKPLQEGKVVSAVLLAWNFWQFGTAQGNHAPWNSGD